jgi:hypothetical protein
MKSRQRTKSAPTTIDQKVRGSCMLEGIYPRFFREYMILFDCPPVRFVAGNENVYMKRRQGDYTVSLREGIRQIDWRLQVA